MSHVTNMNDSCHTYETGCRGKCQFNSFSSFCPQVNCPSLSLSLVRVSVSHAHSCSRSHSHSCSHFSSLARACSRAVFRSLSLLPPFLFCVRVCACVCVFELTCLYTRTFLRRVFAFVSLSHAYIRSKEIPRSISMCTHTCNRVDLHTSMSSSSTMFGSSVTPP